MLTQGRGVRWHLPFRPVGLSPVFNHFSRDGGRLPRHAFPPIIPTPVSCNCGAAYPPLRGSREFFGFSHLPFAKKFCKDLRPGTGGRLCSPNLRFWRPALSIELHPYMCASRLDCHTLLAYPCTGTQGSFQRDSALWSSHLEYSVTMPLGRSTGADSVSTRSAGRSRFLRVGTPWHVIAATASASMTGGHHVPSPGPSDAIGSRYSVFPQSAPWPLERLI